MLKVNIKSEEELLEVARKAITILNNLRRTTQFWEQHYGAIAKNAKKRYEKEADEFLRHLEVPGDHKRVDLFNIVIKNKDL